MGSQLERQRSEGDKVPGDPPLHLLTSWDSLQSHQMGQKPQSPHGVSSLCAAKNL